MAGVVFALNLVAGGASLGITRGDIAEGAGVRGWGRIQSTHHSILAQAALLAEESGV